MLVLSLDSNIHPFSGRVLMVQVSVYCGRFYAWVEAEMVRFPLLNFIWRWDPLLRFDLAAQASPGHMLTQDPSCMHVCLSEMVVLGRWAEFQQHCSLPSCFPTKGNHKPRLAGPLFPPGAFTEVALAKANLLWVAKTMLCWCIWGGWINFHLSRLHRLLLPRVILYRHRYFLQNLWCREGKEMCDAGSELMTLLQKREKSCVVGSHHILLAFINLISCWEQPLSTEKSEFHSRLSCKLK